MTIIIIVNCLTANVSIRRADSRLIVFRVWSSPRRETRRARNSANRRRILKTRDENEVMQKIDASPMLERNVKPHSRVYQNNGISRGFETTCFLGFFVVARRMFLMYESRSRFYSLSSLETAEVLRESENTPRKRGESGTSAVVLPGGSFQLLSTRSRTNARSEMKNNESGENQPVAYSQEVRAKAHFQIEWKD